MTPATQAGLTVGNAVHHEDAIGTPPLRPTLVPVERYYFPAFAQLEAERMWPKVWQVACTVDHVAEPGDYFEYRCGLYSVLVVRGDDGILRAFQNVCRHRGNSLCAGAGADFVNCGADTTAGRGTSPELSSEFPIARVSARCTCQSFH